VIQGNKGEDRSIEDCRIRYLKAEDAGASNLRNLGIEEAQGNILLFTDGRSVVDRDWINAFWHLFQNANIQMAQGRVVLQGQPAEIPSWVDRKKCYSLPFFAPGDKPRHVETLCACNMAARKTVFELYGGFSPQLGPGTIAKIGEDTEFAARVRAFGVPIAYEPNAIAHNVCEEDIETAEYWKKKHYESGYASAITNILVNWEKPRRGRTMIEFLKCRSMHMMAILSSDKTLRPKYEGNTAFWHGILAGTRDATGQRKQDRERKPTLSVCVITQDSAHCIARTLKSVEPICDEIIVVDGGSRDETAEIVRSFDKVRYYLRPWNGNYIEQKNWAINKARSDWVLSIDTDEIVGKHIREKISLQMKSDKHNSYIFPRYWLYSESPLLYVDAKNLYPDYQQRLFRNIPKFRYTIDRAVHHKFPAGLQGRGKKVKDSHLFHFAFLYRDKSERQRIIKTRRKLEPITDRINRNQYLFEEHPHRIRRCKEKL
jgi:glycosyltransferase involved in cell wall biosynthesis